MRGGYRQHSRALREQLLSLGAVVHKGSPVTSIRTRVSGARVRGPLRARRCAGSHGFDHVFFTGPTALAREVVDAVAARPSWSSAEIEYPAAGAYLGVACLVLALKRRLTPFYVLNVGDESIELTGVIEMTNLVDRDAETAGLSLVYVPHYMDSADPRLLADDDAIEKGLVERGLLRMFPDVSRSEFVYHRVHRTKFVAAAPAGSPKPPERAVGLPDVPAPDPQYFDAEVRHPEQRRGGRVRGSLRRAPRTV